MRWRNVLLAAVGAAVSAVGAAVGGSVGQVLVAGGALVAGLAGPQLPRR